MANYINRVTVARYVKDKHFGHLVRFSVFYNGVVHVVYAILGRTFSRFVSPKAIARTAITMRVERSRFVHTRPYSVAQHVILDNNGLVKYYCDYQGCECADYYNNDLDQYLSYRICKQTIRSANLNGITSFNQLSEVIMRQNAAVA